MARQGKSFDNPLFKYGVSEAEIRRAIENSAEVDNAINEKMAEGVRIAKSHAPVLSGEYAAGIKITEKARHGKGRFGATDYKSHWIEYGTGEPGPTKAFAPMQKTVEQLGGTLDGIGAGGDAR